MAPVPCVKDHGNEFAMAQPLRKPHHAPAGFVGRGGDRFPAGYLLSTSTDGVQWSPPVASGEGHGQLTVIDLPATRSRYVRVTQTSTTAQSWAVADLRVYG